MIIGVLGVGFSVFALSRVFLRFREGKVSPAMLGVWVIIWVTVIAFIASPESFSPVSKGLGIQRPLDFMLIGAVVMSYYLLFRIYIKLEDIRSDMAKLSRHIALKKD